MLSDRRHPVVQLEDLDSKESLSGIAEKAKVPLLGSVVLRFELHELGTQKPRPVTARFKICAQGTADSHFGSESFGLPGARRLGVCARTHSTWVHALRHPR